VLHLIIFKDGQMNVFESGTALTFDDVTLEPLYSEIESRSQISTSVVFGKEFKLPLISSNMTTVTGTEMALAMDKAGGFRYFT
jgi:IMP dehydrogenase